MPGSAGCRGPAILAPAIELAGKRLPGVGRVHPWGRSRPGSEWSATIGPDSGFVRVYRPHGRPWRPGEIVRLPALARTLERLADAGFDDFYEGDIAASVRPAGSLRQGRR